MPDEVVHLDIEGGIATITLDSPRNRNALSRQLSTELEDHLTTALGDDAARAVVLTHTGTVFCAGADLKESREANVAKAEGREQTPISLIIWCSGRKAYPIASSKAGPMPTLPAVLMPSFG